MGLLIVFEGPDGVGKTALASALADHLHRHDRNVTSLSFPGRVAGSLGHHIYDLHHDPRRYSIDSLTPESLQALHVAAHLDAIDRFIRPNLEAGQTVILDRYWWSTWVYGIDAGASEKVLDALIDGERLQWGTMLPAAVILVARHTSLRQEDTGPAWARRMDLYRSLAVRERDLGTYPVGIVDNNANLTEALERTLSILREAIGYGRPTLYDPPQRLPR